MKNSAAALKRIENVFYPSEEDGKEEEPLWSKKNLKFWIKLYYYSAIAILYYASLILCLAFYFALVIIKIKSSDTNKLMVEVMIEGISDVTRLIGTTVFIFNILLLSLVILGQYGWRIPTPKSFFMHLFME